MAHRAILTVCLRGRLLHRDVYWRAKHEYFDKYGSMFMVVSPMRNQIVLANAEVIQQVMGNLERFPKDLSRYAAMRIFGENLLTADVAGWRVHRKLTSGSFNEQNSALVFHEAVRQSKGMISLWTKADEAGKTLRTLERDTNTLALHIIGYVGFGISLLWPGDTMPESTSPELHKYASLEAPPGHGLSFKDSLQLFVDHLTLIFIMPIKLLRLLPFAHTKLAAQAWDDFSKYLTELLDEKTEQARNGNAVDVGMDLMGHLARSSQELVDVGTKKGPEIGLTRDEILGNAFVMLVAGHETSANVIHFSIVELAANPASQRRLQKDLDELLGDTDSETWEYEQTVKKLMASMTGAVMNETLRLVPPAIDVPKMVSSERDQVVTMDGKKYTLPKDTGISVVTISTHTSARYWPTKPSRFDKGRSDVLDFVPERWLVAAKEDGTIVDEDDDADTSAQLFRPTAGSYLPFSAGVRSCIGRRIAQVEILATLAVLFREYSVELAVDEWASDEEVSKMSAEEASEVYAKARKKSRDTLATASTQITLKLRDEMHVPVRLVRRGEERFVNRVDMDM
jgi:cytochrome P450